MDRLTRLQALLGEESVCDLPADADPGIVDVAAVAKPRHLYEGTDSEDEQMQYNAFKGSGPQYGKYYFIGKTGLISFSSQRQLN